MRVVLPKEYQMNDDALTSGIVIYFRFVRMTWELGLVITSNYLGCQVTTNNYLIVVYVFWSGPFEGHY